MPSTTKRQARTMAACAHGAALDVCGDIPVKVAKEFNKADTGTKLLSKAMKGKSVGGRVYDRSMNAHAYCVGGPVKKTRW